MAIYEREGFKGAYYGSMFNSSEPLSLNQMQVNARYIFKYFSEMGITTNAICGMLGNMQVESTLNPGRWQNDDVDNRNLGYGLVQWTPASKYINWVREYDSVADPSTMDHNLDRIMYEVQKGLQYIKTSDYPLSFDEFMLSGKSPGYLAKAFLYNYERAGVEAVNKRVEYANYWYEFLTGSQPPLDPDEPSNNTKKKKGFNFVLFGKRRRIYG